MFYPDDAQLCTSVLRTETALCGSDYYLYRFLSGIYRSRQDIPSMLYDESDADVCVCIHAVYMDAEIQGAWRNEGIRPNGNACDRSANCSGSHAQNNH